MALGLWVESMDFGFGVQSSEATRLMPHATELEFGEVAADRTYTEHMTGWLSVFRVPGPMCFATNSSQCCG